MEIIRGAFPGRKLRPGNVSIRGPLEKIEGRMVLSIPLDAGGRELAPFAKGIGDISNGFLVVEIRPWLAEKLDIHVGSLVDVDNLEGKFRITRTGEDRPNQASEPTATGVTPPAGAGDRAAGSRGSP